jgi:hypothetical protein
MYYRPMPKAGVAADSEDDPALIDAVLHGRKSTAAIYWRFQRPPPRAYAVAVALLVAYRLAAAVFLVIALAFFTLGGLVAGEIDIRNWTQLADVGKASVEGDTLYAAGLLSHWAPAVVLLGAVLAIIPRPRGWIAWSTMLGGIGLGYYQRRLPAVPRSATAGLISDWTSPSAGQVTRHLAQWTNYFPGVRFSALLPLAVFAVAGFACCQFAGNLSKRSTANLPRRPAWKYHSPFIAVSVARRLAAAAVTAVLLTADLWLLADIHAATPGSASAAGHPDYLRFSLVLTVLAIIGAALCACTPRPSGYRWLLVVVLFALLVCAYWPWRLVITPIGSPAISPDFWVLTATYLLVTGTGFSLVSGLLDWS